MCAIQPDALGLVVRHQDVRWTWGEVKAWVDAFAAGLLGLGLEPGERVGIWAPNCAEWSITQFATAKAGLVLVNINPAYRLSEAEYALNKVGCRVLITAVSHKTTAHLAMVRELRSGGRVPKLEQVITLGSETHDRCLRFGDVGPEDLAASRSGARGCRFDGPINIQFTSGTTGFPKGATLSHTIS